MVGVKDTIPFRQSRTDLVTDEDEVSEWISVEIPTKANKKIRLTNLYIPPVRSSAKKTARQKKSKVSADKWPITASDCLFGDFNAHSEI